MKRIISYTILCFGAFISSAQENACAKQINMMKSFAQKMTEAQDYNAEVTFTRIEAGEEGVVKYEIHKHRNNWWQKDPARVTYQGDSLSVYVLHGSEMIIMQKAVSQVPLLDLSLIDSIVSIPGQVTCSANKLHINSWEQNPVELELEFENEQIKFFVQSYKLDGAEVKDVTTYDYLSFIDESKVPVDLEEYLFPNGKIRKEFSKYEIQDLRTN